MKKVPFTVTIATILAVFYQVAPHFGISERYMYLLFFLSPFLVMYMAYVILKYGRPSGNTFDERFYDDWDYRRNGKEEME